MIFAVAHFNILTYKYLLCNWNKRRGTRCVIVEDTNWFFTIKCFYTQSIHHLFMQCNNRFENLCSFEKCFARQSINDHHQWASMPIYLFIIIYQLWKSKLTWPSLIGFVHEEELLHNFIKQNEFNLSTEYCLILKQ